MGWAFHFIIFKWKWSKRIRIAKCFFSQLFVFQCYTCCRSVNCTMKNILEFSAKLELMRANDKNSCSFFFFFCECITENSVSILKLFTSLSCSNITSATITYQDSHEETNGSKMETYFSHKHRILIYFEETPFAIVQFVALPCNIA